MPLLLVENVNNYIKNHDVLNPKIWDSKNILNKKIKNKLLEASKLFYKFLDIDVKLEDILITGSLANYNYDSMSDLDVHLVVDYSEIGGPEDLVKNYMILKKNAWKEKYLFTIYGYDVEFFAEDKNNPSFSGGVYSIKNDKWVKKPDRQIINFDKKEIIKKKYQKYKQIALNLIKSENIENIERFKKQIKNERQESLKKEGETSTPNLIFKILRREGILEKLNNRQEELIKQKLSI